MSWRGRSSSLTLGVTACLLVLAATAMAVTYPRDDTGVPAAACSFIDASGRPALCSATNPLPTGGAAPTTAQTDIAGFGKQWFNTGQSTTQRSSLIFTDDTTVYSFANTVEISRNAGRSYQSAVTAGQPYSNVSNVLRVNNQFLIFNGDASGTSSISRSGDTLTWTTVLADAGRVPFMRGAGVQGNTVLAAGTNSISTQAGIYRSADGGASWVFTTNLGSGLAWGGGSNNLTSPAVNVWLGITSNGEVRRSTDDGVTFPTLVNTLTTPSGFVAVECITSAICLATGGRTIDRSIDAGVTWSTVFGSGSTQFARLGGFANFGTGRVCALAAPTDTLQGTCSGDFGVTWTLLGANAGTAVATSGVGTIDVRNGTAVLSIVDSGAPTGQRLYSPQQAAGTFTLTGSSGLTLTIDANGAALVAQGTAAAQSSRWPVFISDGAAERGVSGNPLFDSVRTDAITFPAGVSPIQSGTLFNSHTTGAANTAVVATIGAAASTRAHLYDVKAFCSAGTANLTVADGATTIFQTPAGAVGTAQSTFPWNAGLTGTTNTAMTITLGACGAANTGTLTVQADRF